MAGSADYPTSESFYRMGPTTVATLEPAFGEVDRDMDIAGAAGASGPIAN